MKGEIDSLYCLFVSIRYTVRSLCNQEYALKTVFKSMIYIREKVNQIEFAVKNLIGIENLDHKFLFFRSKSTRQAISILPCYNLRYKRFALDVE